MNFKQGDQVVHWAYGLGKVIQLDEKRLSGKNEHYYVVQINDMTIWVPMTSEGESSLRLPTPAGEFEELFAILTAPAQPLMEDRLQRKAQLTSLLRDGKLASICTVVRDLHFHLKTKKANENDTVILERALNFLLSEWAVSLSVTLSEAKQGLSRLLGDELYRPKPAAH
jgi:CarD family transcriptional regulator